MEVRSNHRPRRALKVALLTTALVSGTAFACICTTGTIIARKFYDANANGIQEPTEVRMSNWPMTLGSAALGVLGTLKTDAFGYAQFSFVPVGTDYTVREGTPLEGNWHQTAPTVNGVPVNPVTGIKVLAGKTTHVAFGNYCTKPSGGRTPGYWHNKNGYATMLDGSPPSVLPELNLLVGLNLVNHDGSAFDPVSHPQFAAWLLDSNATNMANKLSSHLAAMRLNVEANFVNGNRLYAPFGGSINALMAAANASLGANPYTPTGHPQRAYQETLKNYLDALNNGAPVVSPTPCSRTFAPY